MYRECDVCGTRIGMRTSAMEPWDWDEHYQIKWTSAPGDDRTKVIENEYGEQRFPNVGKWYLCSAECLAEFDGGVE